MPIYEYKCNHCGREFEELVTGSEKDVRCPECQSKKLKKLVSVSRGDSLENVLSKKTGDNIRKPSGCDPGEVF